MSVHNIAVPWTNKELQISYQTWNDKTKPGSREQWKIKISGYKKDEVTAEVLTSMYDASLDQFVSNSWAVPDIYPVYSRSNIWDNASNFSNEESRMRPELEVLSNNLSQYNYDELLNFNDGVTIRSGIRMMSALGNKIGEMDIALPAPEKRTGKGFYQDKMASPKTVVTNFTPPGIVKDEEAREEAKPPEADNLNQNNNVPVRIRKNFSETAFFQPDLKTDAMGNVVISFADAGCAYKMEMDGACEHKGSFFWILGKICRNAKGINDTDKYAEIFSGG